MTEPQVPETSRRDFLHAACAGALALAAGERLPAADKPALPQKKLGKRGVKGPALRLTVVLLALPCHTKLR